LSYTRAPGRVRWRSPRWRRQRTGSGRARPTAAATRPIWARRASGREPGEVGYGSAGRDPGRAGCGAAWLARLLWEQEAPGSNPGIPTRSEGISVHSGLRLGAKVEAICQRLGMVEIKRRGSGQDSAYFDHLSQCRDAQHHRGCSGRWRDSVSLAPRRTGSGSAARSAAGPGQRSKTSSRRSTRSWVKESGARPDTRSRPQSMTGWTRGG
jgi:hypothetical protein